MFRPVISASAIACILFCSVSEAFAQFGIHAASRTEVPGWQRMESRGVEIWVNSNPSLTGSDLETARLNVVPNERNSVTLVFNEAGAARMCEFSAANLRKPVAILLDGALLSAPVLENAAGKEVQIRGPIEGFGTNEVQRILASINPTSQAPTTAHCVQVSGRVSRPPADLTSFVELRADRGQYSDRTNIKSDGSFEFPMVPAGSYSLLPWWNGMRIPPPYSSMVVEDKAITGLQLGIPRMLEVSGRVAVEGDGPVPPLQFQLSEGDWVAGVLAFPKPDGSFTITLPEGKRMFGLLAILPLGYTLKSFTYGATNLRGGNTVSIPGEPSAELLLTFAAAPNSWFSVRGRVRNYDSSRMTHVAMKGALLSHFEMNFAPAPILSDGTFEFPKVLKGIYELRVNTPNGDLTTTLDVADRDVDNVELRP